MEFFSQMLPFHPLISLIPQPLKSAQDLEGAEPSTLIPEPYFLNLKLYTLNSDPESYTLNPEL